MAISMSYLAQYSSAMVRYRAIWRQASAWGQPSGTPRAAPLPNTITLMPISCARQKAFSRYSRMTFSSASGPVTFTEPGSMPLAASTLMGAALAMASSF